MPITLTLQNPPEFYLEADCISPDVFAGKSIGDIGLLPVYHGNQERKLSEFFIITGDSGPITKETEIIIEGDCPLVQRLGEKMTDGKLTIIGNCGMHLGNFMKGGSIKVEGNAGEWAGAMMENGSIEISGNAGNHCASAYRGFWVGMTGGMIKVQGQVGVESGSWMRSSKTYKKYPILWCGSADYYLGVHNHGGTLICNGDVEGRVGADMSHGQIIIMGKVKSMLPSFIKKGEVKEVVTPAGDFKGKYIEYTGDHAIPKPNGSLFVRK
ncbi:MAG: formylmethanofuran dehydrogenase subunit C [Candidatus Lokiarchaeota archaeon]|nr:formylmethanofuran dehydrogenase subunit C [Candidatus Lokiarchaeota archaeon]